MKEEVKNQIINFLEEFQKIVENKKHLHKLGVDITFYSSFVNSSLKLIEILLKDKENPKMLEWWIYGSDRNIYKKDGETILYTLDTPKKFVNYMLNEYRNQP